MPRAYTGCLCMCKILANAWRICNKFAMPDQFVWATKHISVYYQTCKLQRFAIRFAAEFNATTCTL